MSLEKAVNRKINYFLHIFSQLLVYFIRYYILAIPQLFSSYCSLHLTLHPSLWWRKWLWSFKAQSLKLSLNCLCSHISLNHRYSMTTVSIWLTRLEAYLYLYTPRTIYTPINIFTYLLYFNIQQNTSAIKITFLKPLNMLSILFQSYFYNLFRLWA